MHEGTANVGKSVTNEDIYQLLQAVNARNNSIENRLKHIEDTFCKEIQQVNEKVQLLEEENKQLKRELQDTQKKQKKYNIVIYGITETEPDLLKNILEVITTKLNVTCTESDIRDIYRLGKPTDNNKSRPTLIELVSFQKKIEVLKNTPKLKGTGIFIKSDLTAQELEDNKVLIKHLQQARQKKYNARIYKNQLIVNGDVYKVEDLIDDSMQWAITPTSNTEEIRSTVKEKVNSAPATPDANAEERTRRNLRSNLHLAKNLERNQTNSPDTKDEIEITKKKKVI